VGEADKSAATTARSPPSRTASPASVCNSGARARADAVLPSPIPLPSWGRGRGWGAPGATEPSTPPNARCRSVPRRLSWQGGADKSAATTARSPPSRTASPSSVCIGGAPRSCGRSSPLPHPSPLVGEGPGVGGPPAHRSRALPQRPLPFRSAESLLTGEGRINPQQQLPEVRLRGLHRHHRSAMAEPPLVRRQFSPPPSLPPRGGGAGGGGLLAPAEPTAVSPARR
jgi:hypothetical protein